MANGYPTCTRRTQQPDTPTNAGNLEVTRFTPSTDSSVGTMMTFNLDMGEVSPPKKRPRSKEELKRTNEMRLRGACIECRSKKRQCKPEHPPSKPVAKKRGRGHPHSSYRSLDLYPAYSTQAKTSQDFQVHPRLISETPSFHSGTNGRRASLSSDIHPDQPSMILPGQFYPLYSGPCLNVSHCPGAVSSQFVGTTWPTPYPPDQKGFHLNIGDMPWPKRDKEFHECLLFPYVQEYMGYTEDYATHSGPPTNIGPRFTAFNPYDVPCGDWLHLDDSHRVQEMRHPYHDGFYKDRSGISHSTHQTQEMVTLTGTQGFGWVPGESPRLLQARLQKSENADPKALTGSSPAHQAVDLHGILGLPPMESSTDQSPLPLQSSGNPVSSQGFLTHSRGSSPENAGFDWMKI